MSWFMSLIAILLYLRRKSMSKLFRKKDSLRRKPQSTRKNASIIRHYELLDQLQENIGQEVVIKFKNLSHLYENQITNQNNEFSGKILAMDDEWIKLEFQPSTLTPDRSPDYLYFKTDIILDFRLVD